MTSIWVGVDVSNSNEDLMLQMKELKSKFDSVDIGREGMYIFLGQSNGIRASKSLGPRKTAKDIELVFAHQLLDQYWDMVARVAQVSILDQW
jgi:hypothetical protein